MIMENVKVGDLVAVRLNYQQRVVPVTHVTPTRFTAGGRTFSKADGRPYGLAGSYADVGFATIASPAQIMAERCTVARERLAKLIVTPSNIDAVEQLINPTKQ